ncbi:uncharacterized protein l(2)SH0834 isoform X1 [Anabrus simplex]|uniref:uncharacterized protein l(2)SH0834 isoform X1 n=1 Tax=Anabrus simplex TaxID=316456 RepID=UPI0034DDA6B3
MAENTLAARREARRRRILENSEERLKRITGNSKSTAKGGFCTDHGVQNGPVEKSESSEEKINGAYTNQFGLQNFEDRQFETPDEVANTEGLNALPKLLGSVSDRIDRITLPERIGSQPVTFLQSIQDSRFHFVGVAALVQLLFYIDWGFVFGESIFIPLLIFEVTDILLMKAVTMRTPSSRAGGIVGTVLMLSGVAPNKASAVSTCLSVLAKIGKDFAVYFVSFVAIHCLLAWPG